MADDEDGEETGTDLVLLPDLRRIEPLLKRLPQVRENLTKVFARVFGSPERTRSMAGAEATADALHDVQGAKAEILHAAAERAANEVASGADAELAMRAIDRLGNEAVRHQVNLEKTLSLAVDEAPAGEIRRGGLGAPGQGAGRPRAHRLRMQRGWQDAGPDVVGDQLGDVDSE